MMSSILNYIQNLQANSQAQGAQDPYAQVPSQPQQAPQMPEQSMQQMPPQQNMLQQTPQAQYNPFNSGIKNAIEAARESLGMTNKQQEKAFNKGLINFATNFSQQPVRKGFFNNFGAASRSMLPALSEYSGAEAQYENQNNALANQILDRQAAEQQRLAQEEQQLWSRQMQEDQLNETRRAHDMTNARVDDRTSGRGGSGKGHGESSTNDLEKTLDMAEATIDKLGDKGFRGRTANIFNTLTPGGIRLDEDQAKINTLGDILKGKLFNSWGYRNQAEFEHVPTISANNPPEVNKAIVQQLKEILLDKKSILMQDAQGNKLSIPSSDIDVIEEAIKDGFNEV